MNAAHPPPKGLGASPLSPSFYVRYALKCTLYTVQYTVYFNYISLYNYINFIYRNDNTPWSLRKRTTTKMVMSKLESWSLGNACQNGHYKLHDVINVKIYFIYFHAIAEHNPLLLIINLSKFRRLAWWGQEGFVVGALPPPHPLATALCRCEHHPLKSKAGLSTTWLRSQIWLLGKIYLAPLRFILCNAFWLRRVKRVQRKYIKTIYCTMYIRDTL